MTSQATFALIEECRAALAEELSAWDIDPPLHHVKHAHDKCVAWLAATQPAPQPEAKPEKFFSYGVDSGFDLHDTAKAAIEAAQTDIDQYRSDAMFDDEWSDDVEWVCWGVVLGSAREVEVEPPDEDAADRRVDYRLTNAIPPQPEAQASPAPAPLSGLVARAEALHLKAGMPWTEAEKLALDEAGIDEAAVDELIGNSGQTGLGALLTTADDLREFVRSVIVHGEHLFAGRAQQ